VFMSRALKSDFHELIKWYFSTMRTTIDAAGRVVIPKQLRQAAALEPGQELEIVERDGRIEIQPVSAPMTLVERDGFLAAEVTEGEPPTMTTEEVRDLIERTRR
jgi:AbrB family looped-hinge helix DNA binding protein